MTRQEAEAIRISMRDGMFVSLEDLYHELGIPYTNPNISDYLLWDVDDVYLKGEDRYGN